MNSTLAQTQAASRSERLAEVTDQLHEHLHTLVAAAAPFSQKDRYIQWLKVQYRFQSRIAPLYQWVASDSQFALPERGRLKHVEQDLTDLRQPLPDAVEADPTANTLPKALGWLFVSEGSTLGAAILLKRASQLGMTETFGARHLAPAPEGRGRHWKAFISALNELPFNDAEETQLQDGACTAFIHFGKLLEEEFALVAQRAG
ncbi:biliverdin-producing heme oxygenase [Marinimicrobium sp. ARAG 43.8]|uniref:biliverdin-producing heme oxygenase n=1 Tax=Marinimicrobium sp. ARAG 43.8 TaxID=3418719 RepID=UPI003CF4115D